MRQLLFLLFLTTTITSLAQRISFEDPDLTFSFKKPNDWQVFDDGYAVKVSPSPKDTTNTYFSITYFEDAQPFGIFPLTDGLESADGPKKKPISYRGKIAGENAKYLETRTGNSIQTIYLFYKFGQRFQVITKEPLNGEDKKNERVFNRMIRSIRVSQ